MKNQLVEHPSHKGQKQHNKQDAHRLGKHAKNIPKGKGEAGGQGPDGKTATVCQRHHCL